MRRAIVYGCDDVLVKTHETVLGIYGKVAGEMTLEMPFDPFFAELDGSPEDAAKKVWGLKGKRLEDFARRYREEEAERTYPPVDGAPRTLEFTSRYYITGVVTNRSEESLTGLMKDAGIRLDSFDFAITPRKKNGNPFSRLARELDREYVIVPEQATCVSNDIEVYKACRDTGFDFIAVLTGPTTREQFLEAGVNESHILPSVAELPGLLESEEPLNERNKGQTPRGIDDTRVIDFANDVGPKVRKYIGDSPVCVIGIPGGGTFYAMRLRSYLLEEGVDDVKYYEMEKSGNVPPKEFVEGRKVVVVDDAISTGRTFRMIARKLRPLRKRHNVVDIAYAVEHDILGLADFFRGSEDKRKGFFWGLFGGRR